MIEQRLVKYDKFNPEPLNFLKKGTKSVRFVGEDFMCLDTETSNNHNEENFVGWLYQWCFMYNGELVYGRKPSELIQALEKIRTVNKLADNKTIIVYVHNLSYDYTYIKDFLEDYYGEKGETLAIKSHNLITYKIKGFEFRCSYKLSMKSLASWGKDLNIKHKKLVGTVDYSVIRYQNSPLTKKDWKYMFYDVIALDECIRKQFELYNDNTLTVPYTSTGYVRRECRKRFQKDDGNRNQFLKTKLNLETYLMCKKAFAGGLTHGNRFKAGRLVQGTIRHRDFASHYPSQQVCYTFPTTPFTKYYDFSVDGDITIEDLLEESKKSCLLISIGIKNMHLKKGVTLPYAQTCKFYDGRVKNEKFDTIEDNGRILDMNSTSMVYLTDIDLKWLNKQYTFDYQILTVFRSKRGRSPEFILDTVNQYFYDKTYYKNLENSFKEDTPEWIEAHIKLMISKGLLNGIYGMTATDPVRIGYYEDEQGEWHEEKMTSQDIKDKLYEFYGGYNSFMSYQLGVWVTANARNELLEFVELIGYENFLYADTDSIFYISNEEVENRIEAKNKEFRDINDIKGYYIEIDGKRTYYNQFELEKDEGVVEDIIEFKFLHAKCYGYRLVDGKLKVTIAGVSKYGRNDNTRVKELGSLHNLQEGYTFYDCGGTRTVYTNSRPSIAEIDDHLTEFASSAIIVETEKTLHNALTSQELYIEWEC